MDGFDSPEGVFASQFNDRRRRSEDHRLWWLAVRRARHLVLLRTRFGNWIFAVGGNAGPRPRGRCPGDPHQDRAVHAVSFPAWFFGMHTLFPFNTLQSGEGVGNEFIYIIAAVVGGCLLTGGYGSAIGVAIGAFIFGMTSRHRLRRLEPGLVQGLPRRHAAARRPGQPVRQEALDHAKGGLA